MPKIDVLKSTTLTGHRDCIYTLENSDKNYCFYSSGGDGMVVMWNLKDPDKGELIAKVEKSVYALHYLESKDSLLIGENFEGLHEIDLKGRKEVRSTKLTTSSIFDIKSFEDRIYIACGDGTVAIVSLGDLTTIAKLNLSEKSARCISINPVRRQAAIGFSDNWCRIVDLDTLKVITTIPAHQSSLFALTYSPDYSYLITGSRDAHLKIWDVEQEYQLKDSIVAHMYAINHIVYSPDGLYFATCSMDKSIKIWDAKEFRLLKVIDRARHAGHGTSVNKLYWTSFEGKLISASDDRSISVWDIHFNLN